MKIKNYLLCILSMIFWGMSFVWLKVVFDVYNPIAVIFFRLLLASIALTSYQFLFKKRDIIDKKDYKMFLLLALFQPFLYFIGESFGLLFVSSIVASVIISTIPVVTPIFSYLFLREKLTIAGIAGMIISFLGVLLIIIEKDFTFKYSIKGLLLLFLAVLAAIFNSLVVRKMIYKYRPLTLLNAQNLIGALYFMPFFFIFDFKKTIEASPTIDVILNFLYLVVFSSIFAFLFFNISIKELGVNVSGFMSNLIPIFTAITAYIILKESLTGQKISGIIIVITGLIIGNYKRRKKYIQIEY